MAYPRFQRARSFKFLTRTAGALTPNSTSWTDLTTAMDIVLNAQVGDVIEYGATGSWGTEAVGAALDIATIVSGSVVNTFLSGNNNSNDGAVGWYGIPSVTTTFGGSVMYTVQAGDISSGLVTLRLRVRCSSAATKSLQASAVDPFQVWAKNLGPVDPN